ncbi:putative C-S lyase [Puteibacter caeruleilacunae]|nr:putative C-S lyase [Puteibacter caeruleilacunae]
MTYNFDTIVDRRNTNCIKYDALEHIFGVDDILPLWVADTDFEVPDFILDAIKGRAEHPVLGYTFRGDEHYEAIQGWMERRHNWKVDRNWITSSPGVVAGLTLAINALTKPGDKIVVQPPVYFPFFDSVKGTNRVLVENPLKKENGRFHFDMEDLKAKVDEDTKMIILSNPHNPGGTAWTRDELEELGNFCVEHDIIIISDEIHQDLAFSGHVHTPMASISEKIAQQTIICTAASKTFNIAGLATSIVIIPNRRYKVAYEKELHVAHLDMGNIFGILALEAAYTKGDDWTDQMMDYVEENYNYLEQFISERIPQLKVMKPEATFLVWIDFSALGFNDKELMEFLLQKAKVGLSDGPRFGVGGEFHARINIGCPKSVLEEGLKRIEKAVNEL